MRKLIALMALSIAVLIAPAAVGAAKKTYGGAFESSGELQFDLKKANKGKKILDFTFAGFPVQCDSGSQTTSGHLTFAIKVKNNKFEADAISTNPGSESKLNLTGKLKNGGQAEGTLKVHGANVLIDNPPNTRDNCTSPKTDWTASTD